MTLPHKENALRYLMEKGAEVEELAQKIGAVNTIIIEGGKLRGINTDYAAILDSISDAMGIGWEGLKGKKVAVIGAGGTGRTAVAALSHFGADITVFNRTLVRAEELAREFDGKGAKVRAARLTDPLGSPEIVINTTSIGMYPKIEVSPISGDELPNGAVVFDTIYNPMKTRLLIEAEQRGAKTIRGMEMFVRQAAGQFRAWTGMEPPIELMRKVIVERIGK